MNLGDGIVKGGDPSLAETTELRSPGGEFRSRSLEATFAAERAGENRRQAQVLLVASAILNTLFFASDWRFAGTPHFWVAIPARAIVVATALVCLLLLRKDPSPQWRRGVMIGWMAVNGLAVGALVSSHSNIALFVVIMLPLIYYLAVPVPFRWTIAGGAGCSVVMLACYEGGAGDATTLGLVLAMLILNVALSIVVTRSNRLERMAWLAARAERRIVEELALARAESERVFAASPVPKVVTAATDGRIVRYNDSAVEFFGAQPEFTNIGAIYVDGEDRTRLLEILRRDGEVRDFETRIRRADGSIRTVLIKATTVDLAGGPMILSGFIDITDRKAIEENLERLATTDALTGLPNRLSFFKAARAEMLRSARTGAPLALLMIDIDHFKQINDGFGHAGGDEALRAFASSCQRVLGGGGVVARLGGEEFAILLPGTDMTAAVAFAERLRETMAELPIKVRRGAIRLTASIGVALVDARERELDPALARADQALYAAKHGGRNRVVAANPTSARRAG